MPIEGPYLWMRPNAAAEVLGVPARRLRQWGRAGLISCLHDDEPGRERRYIQQEIYAIAVAQHLSDVPLPDAAFVTAVGDRCGFPVPWRAPGGPEIRRLDAREP